MGGKYSKVVNDYFPDLKVLQNLNLDSIRKKINNIAKESDREGVYFLTKADIVQVFKGEISDVHIYQCMLVFDYNQNGRISSLDFWGALVMFSAGSNAEKVKCCWEMLDLNGDGFLSFNDIVVLIICVTRGIAKMRGYMLMSPDFIDRYLVEAFRVNKKMLNENGEMPMSEFRTFLLSDELTVQYLAALGTAEVPVDAAALVIKRADLLKEAVHIESQIAELVCEIESLDGSVLDIARKERGGDLKLVKISEQDKAEIEQENLRKLQELVEMDTQKELKSLQAAAEANVANGSRPATATQSDYAAGHSAVAVVAPASTTYPVASHGMPIESSFSGSPNVHLTICASDKEFSAKGGKGKGTKGKEKSASDYYKGRPVSPKYMTRGIKSIAIPKIHPCNKMIPSVVSIFDDDDDDAADGGADENGDDTSTTINIYSERFRQKLRDLWIKLPHFQDFMTELDEYTLVVLFGRAGVDITYDEATKLLNLLDRSQLGRYDFDNLVRMYRIHSGDIAKPTDDDNKPPGTLSVSGQRAKQAADWTAFTHYWRDIFYWSKNTMSDYLQKAADMRAAIDSVEFHDTALKYVNPLRPDKSSGSGGAVSGAAGKELNFIMKLVEFRNMTSRKPSDIALRYYFNHPERSVVSNSQLPSANTSRSPSRQGLSSKQQGRVGPGSRKTNSSGPASSNGTGTGAIAGNDGDEDDDDMGFAAAFSQAKSKTFKKRSGNNGDDENADDDDTVVYDEEGPVSAAETLPQYKTRRLDDVKEWKMSMKFTVTANPFTNLSTKRPKESSRVKTKDGANYIEDFLHLQSQDMLDYLNLLQEKEAKRIADEAAAERAAEAAAAAEAVAAEALARKTERLSGKTEMKVPTSTGAAGTGASDTGAEGAQVTSPTSAARKKRGGGRTGFKMATGASTAAAGKGKAPPGSSGGIGTGGIANVDSADAPPPAVPSLVNMARADSLAALTRGGSVSMGRSSSFMSIGAGSVDTSAAASTGGNAYSNLSSGVISEQTFHGVSIKVFNSVIWVCLQIKPGLKPEQEQLLLTAAKNYFEAIPMHLREDIYSYVFADIFPIMTKGMQASAPGKKQSDLASMMMNFVLSGAAGSDSKFNVKKVVLVGLYHERDFFLEVEKKLIESGVFASRAMTSAALDVHVLQSFQEVMHHAQQYDHYGERLFGPQEEEMGEDGMNPLRFAKEMRARRRELSDLASPEGRGGKLRHAELVQHCRRLGLKDKGTRGELSKVVQAAYALQAELTGFGELSKFGEDLITKMFHRFKKGVITDSAEDGGLTLWEMNELLATIGAPTFYDMSEYKRFVEEFKLLTDRQSRLRLRGLQAYYRENGRLKLENDSIGVGSLNEKLSGRLNFQSTFEPDALFSLLGLLGNNAANIPTFLRRVCFMSSVKDFRMEGELEFLSELFQFLDTDLGNNFNKNILCNPGWLSRIVNSLSAYLADGEAGVVPTLRRYLRNHFGRFDNWEPHFTGNALSNEVQEAVEDDEELRELQRRLDALVQAAHDEEAEAAAAAAAEEAEAAAAAAAEEAEAEAEAAASVLAGLQSARSPRSPQRSPQRTPRSQLPQAQQKAGQRSPRKSDAASAAVAGLKGGVSTSASGGAGASASDAATTSGESTATGVPPKSEEEELQEQIEQRRREILQETIDDILPPMPQNGLNIDKTLLQMREDLTFLNEVRGYRTVQLTLEESNAVAERKEYLIKRIDELMKTREENEKLFAAHSCAFYDAFRLFSDGVSNCGFGSKDFCVRGATEGVDWATLLPAGLGELSPVKQAAADKMQRAKERKAAALAALERERLRRNMTEEEKEAIRREKHLAMMREWAEEETGMFQQAYAKLYEFRESGTKGLAESNEMLKLWEDLLALKELRDAQDVGVAVMKNNVACLVMEIFTLDHPRGSPGQYILEEAANLLIQGMNDPDKKVVPLDAAQLDAVEAESTSAGATASSSATESESESTSEFPPGVLGSVITERSMIPGSILIMVNYITTLLQTNSIGQLARAFPIKRHAYRLYRMLSEEEQEKLKNGIVPVIKQMLVFPHVNLAVTLGEIVEEISCHLDDGFVRNAREEERRRIAEEEAKQEQQRKAAVDSESARLAAMTPAQLRREKRRKFEEQRRKDNKLRAMVSQQRKVLYDLVQTDEISDIFASKASGSVKAAKTPDWGTESSKKSIRAESAISKLASTLGPSSSKREIADWDEEGGEEGDAEEVSIRNAAGGGLVGGDGVDGDGVDGESSAQSHKSDMDEQDKWSRKESRT